jgi:histone deacetylase complex subunit SAP18
VQIYTWPDATLKEIATLMKDVIPEASQPNAVLSFSLVYPDKDGRNVIKPVRI